MQIHSTILSQRFEILISVIKAGRKVVLQRHLAAFHLIAEARQRHLADFF